MIEKGYIYVACPPLYKTTAKGKAGEERYFFDQSELDKYLASLPQGSSAPQLQRFKG